MQTIRKKYITEEDYLEMERRAPFKSEYYRGEVFAMGGASFVHNLISSNLQRVILPYLKGKSCKLFSNDLRIHVPQPPFFSYPDMVIICGTPEFLDNEFDTITNPKIIIEILSTSTENYDRETKFGLYGFAQSFEEYILVHQDKPLIEYFRKVQNVWQNWEIKGLENNLKINNIELEIQLKDIYEDVEFKNKEVNFLKRI